LRSWLYGTTTPPMPGHPNWKVTPVKPSVSAAGRSASAPAAWRRR
jgi:hypothetical protein